MSVLTPIAWLSRGAPRKLQFCDNRVRCETPGRSTESTVGAINTIGTGAADDWPYPTEYRTCVCE